jgi:hypothetical protein
VRPAYFEFGTDYAPDLLIPETFEAVRQGHWPFSSMWIATGHTDMRRGMNSLALPACLAEPLAG